MSSFTRRDQSRTNKYVRDWKETGKMPDLLSLKALNVLFSISTISVIKHTNTSLYFFIVLKGTSAKHICQIYLGIFDTQS